jgi:hypothetical protein
MFRLSANVQLYIYEKMVEKIYLGVWRKEYRSDIMKTWVDQGKETIEERTDIITKVRVVLLFRFQTRKEIACGNGTIVSANQIVGMNNHDGIIICRSLSHLVLASLLQSQRFYRSSSVFMIYHFSRA